MIIEKHLYVARNNSEIELDYYLYFPNHYKKNNLFPLLLFLHGAGERGQNLEKVKAHGIPKRIDDGIDFPFIIVAPQCPDGVWWPHGKNVDTVLSLIKSLVNNFKINPRQIYGTGLSMGGFGVLELASINPKLFAAIIPICGGIIRNKLSNLYNLPIWLFHGDKDEVVPVESSILIYKWLKKYNKNIRITIYENVTHDSWTQTYENQEIYDWLLGYQIM